MGKGKKSQDVSMVYWTVHSGNVYMHPKAKYIAALFNVWPWLLVFLIPEVKVNPEGKAGKLYLNMFSISYPLSYFR